jgi:heme A synthase
MDFYRWVKAQWDRAAAIVALVVGVLALLLGWLGVSDATLPTQQISYLASGGLFGLFALGVAATLWLSADLRDEWRKLDDIHKSLSVGPDASSIAEVEGSESYT